MPFISVVPAVRTPFGVDVFDYRITENADLQPGDLIRVPFRKKQTPALILSRNAQSAYADKAVAVTDEAPLVRLGPDAVDLLEQTARHTFTSRPSVLLSWIRNVPQRAVGAHGMRPGTSDPNGGRAPHAPTTILTVDRIATVIQEARSAHGRVLVLTPWKQRADMLAAQLGACALHADLADGAAWAAWTDFVRDPERILVATRIGAWLACRADAVIVDEPENDDFKQDELAPRVDARRLVTDTRKKRASLRIVSIGTTPMLSTGTPSADIPTIDVPLTLEPWQRGSSSPVEGLSASVVQRIEEALENHRGVIILHPVRGDRPRISCRDCSWSMICAFCRFPLSREGVRGRCRRCGRAEDIPLVCPSCGGADLNKSRSGKDRLTAQTAQRFGAGRVTVVDLPDWHKTSMKRDALLILTDLSLVGGFTEDIRRRERLVIAWRRLAASVASAGGELIVQGPEDLLSHARAWLGADGVRHVWNEELAERAAFGYPPARRRIKLLVDGTQEKADEILQRLSSLLEGWKAEGPFPVLFRSHTRAPRHVIHLLPPDGASESSVRDALEPFADRAIIDLDPIAFFS